MRRKLVKQGMNALTLTMPSDWVRRNNLKPGDEIDLTEQDNSITLSAESAEKKQSLKEITVDVSGLMPRLADRFLARAYQKGYDRIIVKFDDPELKLAIQNKVSELMGFEILRAEKNELEIQVISNQLDIDFDTMLRRAMLVLMDMDDPAEIERAESFVQRLNARAIAMDGTCTGEHGIGQGKMAFLEREHGAGVGVMRAIKAALDPLNIMNPGKMPG